MTHADVVVVGAGPAGSMAGLLLAREGLDVLLLDRAEFPRAKPCGECLSAGATDLLERHGLLPSVRRAGAAEIHHWDIVAPDGTEARGFLGQPALALERRIFDALLVDAAVESGCRFVRAQATGLVRDGSRVTGVSTRNGGFTARLVVGADGLRSMVARELGLIRRQPRLRKISLTTHVEALEDMHHGVMHVLDGGCFGLAPVGPSANLTLVVAGEEGTRLRTLGPQAFFREWLREVPSLWDRYGTPRPDSFLASGPFDWPTRSAAGFGAALVGDAAGYYDPFTGQGIYQAMAGAELLAEVLAPVFAEKTAAVGPDPDALDRALATYARARSRWIRPARRVQQGVEAVLSRPALANAAVARLGRAHLAMDRIIDVIGDIQPPRSLLSSSVASSFMFPPERRPH